jgi:alanine-synthesizing transaminase
VLIVDEVFADFPLERTMDALPTALADPQPKCPVYVLSGLSKTALLPQVKLGWILSRGPHLHERLDALDYLSDQVLSVSASAQAAAPDILRLAPALREQVLRRAKANLRGLDEALKPYEGLGRLPVEGGWSVLLRRPAVDSDEACALRLLEAGVLVHPGHFFDLPKEGYLVLSLLTPEADFMEGLSRILPLLRS